MAYCPECGTRIQKTAGICKSCGHVLVWEEVQDVKPRKKRRPAKCAEHPQNKSIGRCTKCGKAVCIPCSTSFKNELYCLSCIDEIMHDMPTIEEQPKRLPRRRHEPRELEHEQGKSGKSIRDIVGSALKFLGLAPGFLVMGLAFIFYAIVALIVTALVVGVIVGVIVWFFGGCEPDYNAPDYEPDYDVPPRPWSYIIPESLSQNSYTLLLDDHHSGA